jgi:hypothetical protein
MSRGCALVVVVVTLAASHDIRIGRTALSPATAPKRENGARPAIAPKRENGARPAIAPKRENGARPAMAP